MWIDWSVYLAVLFLAVGALGQFFPGQGSSSDDYDPVSFPLGDVDDSGCPLTTGVGGVRFSLHPVCRAVMEHVMPVLCPSCTKMHKHRTITLTVCLADPLMVNHSSITTRIAGFARA